MVAGREVLAATLSSVVDGVSGAAGTTWQTTQTNQTCLQDRLLLRTRVTGRSNVVLLVGFVARKTFRPRSLEGTSRNDEASRRLTGLLVGAGSLGSVDAGLLTLRALVSPRRDRLLAQLRPPGRHAARPLQLLLPRHLGDEGRRQRVYGIGAAPAPHARGRGPRIRERLPLLPKRHQRA